MLVLGDLIACRSSHLTLSYYQIFNTTMMNTIKGLGAVFAMGLLLFLSACGGDGPKAGADNDMSTHVPTDASGVFLIQLGSMLDKADYPAFTKTKLFEEFLEEVQKETPALVPFVEDPASSGIDMTGNIAIYFKADANEKARVGMLMPIADADKLNKMIEALKKEDAEIKTTDHEGYQLHTFDDDGFILQSSNFAAITNFNDDAALQALLKPTGKGIRDNEEFTAQVPTGKDLVYWFDGDQLLESNPRLKMQLNGVIPMLGLPKTTLSNNNIYGYQNFEEGRMEGTMDLGFNKDLREKLASMLPDQLAVDYANYFPGDDLAAAVSLGVTTSGLLAFLNDNGMAMFADNYLQKLGLDIGQLEKGLTGDLAVGLYPERTESNDAVFVAVLGLKEKAFVEKQLERGAALIKRDGERYVFRGQPGMDGSPALAVYGMVQDDAFVISNKSEQLDKALAGNSNSTMSNLQKGWMGLYLNYDLIEKGDLYQALAANLPMGAGGLEALKTSQQYQNVSTAQVIATVDQIKGISILKDKNMNALKSTLMTLNKMHEEGLFDQQIEEDEFDEFEDAFDELEEAEETTSM